MSRRRQARERIVLPDPLFRSKLLAKFINSVMCGGKKSLAERIVYGALQRLVEVQGDDGDGGEAGGGSSDIRTNKAAREKALKIFKQALENVTPVVEVKSRRVGGSTYQVPVEIRAVRQRALAMRWLVDYASKRSEDTMWKRLAEEILAASKGAGGAVKKREDVHRMAEANKAFAHYRW